MDKASTGQNGPCRANRLLYIGMHYWPEETGAGPYASGIAEHLSSRGWNVTMLTGMPYYPYWRVFDSYRGKWRLKEHRCGVEIRRFHHYIPNQQNAVSRALFDLTFLVHALPTALRPVLVGAPRPDLILADIPALSDGVLAAIAARRFGVPFGIIYHDLVAPGARQTGIAGGAQIAAATRSLEGWIARQARKIAVISEGMRPYLRGLGVPDERIILAPFWPNVQESTRAPDEARAALGWSAEEQVVLHAGNLGLKQGLENVVDAARLAHAASSRLQFVFLGDGNQRPMLERRAAGLPNVTFLDPMPAADFPNALAAADILLLNERPSLLDMCLPSKLMSYLVAGRPIVAAVAPDGVSAEVVEQSGAGLVVPAGEPPALLSTLDRVATDTALAARLAVAGPGYAREHLGKDVSLTRYERFACDLLL